MRLWRKWCRSRLLFVSGIAVTLYLTLTFVTLNLKTEEKVALPVEDYKVANNDGHGEHGDGKPKAAAQIGNENNGRAQVDSVKDLHLDSKTCKEKHNFVFIKCMKCATETMATIIRRFGYTRNLSFVTPVSNKLYLGWPYLMTEYDIRPSSRGYNIIMEHSIYNKTIMQKLMPKDTLYISIIREPFSHVKSTINYFKVLQILDITSKNGLSEYLHNLEKYEVIYKSPEKHQPRFCIPDGFSMTKNLMSHCHGMPLGFPPGRDDISGDPAAVDQYIQDLGKEFYFMMLVEYFHESLVLLKRKMCWTFQDILYKSVNTGNYTYKDTQPDPELVAIYKKWSPVDYKLYDYFNRTFWQTVDKQSNDFFDEVAAFDQVQKRVSSFCDYGGLNLLKIETAGGVQGLAWSDMTVRCCGQTYSDGSKHVIIMTRRYC
ncbi:galactose-3-O-sulfotransferase 2-like [Haliotis rubra]|uniref:galactose-3-O-sulfotransferase 2-like n=1 Tax=Haliotis rubra TaxID=36100 RepID=UPI001EE59755|nr:galactose-3-O-sulfotransferase 2-like [Haliotis rubra]